MNMNIRTPALEFYRIYLRLAVVLATALLLGCQDLRAASSPPTFTATPATVSNSYTGFITLQISGLTNGEIVRIAKYLDGNTNSVVDASDMLVQNFSLTDGRAMTVGGATNINVPGDATLTDSSITARVNFFGGGFDQQIIGRYAYVLYSPAGHFTPLTNWFTVTNSAYAQSVTGTVRSSGTNVPYAVAMLFTPPTGDSGMNPVAGTVANSSGNFSLKAAPGTYLLWAFKSNFVASLMSSPIVALGAGVTVNTNLTLSPATGSISGQVVDATNTSRPIPGISVFWMSTNNEIGSGFTDTNGYFKVGVTAGEWQFGGDEQVFSFLGYLSMDKGSSAYTGTGSVGGLVLAVPKANALIYGSVKDTQNRPLTGVSLNCNPSGGSGVYRGAGISDAEGNYAMGLIGGTWGFEAEGRNPAFANYIFSKPFDTTNLNDGQAIRADVTAVLATNHITGYVRDNSNQPVGNIGVYASVNINGTYFDQYSDTDSSGFYSLTVASGSWNVGLNCGGGNDSLQNQGYLCVENQTVKVGNADAVLNFTVTKPTSHITGFVTSRSGGPIPNVGVSASDSLSFNAYGQTGPDGSYTLNVPNGTFTVNVSCGESSDSLGTLGYLCVDQQTVSVNNSTAIANFAAMPAPYQLSGFVVTSGGAPVANLGISASATLNGTEYNFYVHTDLSGYYSFRVANGSWSIWPNCSGGGDSLNAMGYLCVDNQTVNVAGGNATLDFTVRTAPSQITGYVMNNLGNPIANVGVGAWATVNGTNLNVGGSTDGTGHYVLLVANGSWTVNVACGGGNGCLDQLGYLCVGSQTANVTNANAVVNFTTFPAPCQISGYVLDSTNHPLANLGVYASATIGGVVFNGYSTTDASGYYHFAAANGTWAIGLDCMTLSNEGYRCPGMQTNTVAGANLAVNFTVQPKVPLRITTPSLPNATVGTFYSQTLQATGGQPPYFWELSMGSGPLPPGLNLSPDGTISGMPGSTGTFSFSVRAYDNASANDDTNQPLSITVNAPSQMVRLTGTTLLPNGQIQFRFNTVSGQNYTVQYSFNLSTWSALITVPGTGSTVTYGYPYVATEGQRFYRVKVGP